MLKPISYYCCEELKIIPKQVCLLRYYVYTYACKQCEESTAYSRLLSYEASPQALLVSPATTTEVMAQKCVDGIPLERQEKIWKRESVEFRHATPANWVNEDCRRWLRPSYRLFRKQLTEPDVIVRWYKSTYETARSLAYRPPLGSELQRRQE